jgi:uncharacterized protein (TIGR02145 family)
MQYPDINQIYFCSGNYLHVFPCPKLGNPMLNLMCICQYESIKLFIKLLLTFRLIMISNMNYKKAAWWSLLFLGIRTAAVIAQTVTDIDGNVYKTVIIFGHVWMAENLKTTRYNDSTKIPLAVDNETWAKAGPAYCWYDCFENADSNTYRAMNNWYTYGALYNRYSVNTNKICPTGWHVSTHKEWDYLLDHLGIYVAGWSLKEKGTSHWRAPNKGVTNETGFSALPGGFRKRNGDFRSIKENGCFWGAPGSSFSIPWVQFWNYRYGRFCMVVPAKKRNKQIGLSVRCIKDNLQN